MPASPSGDTRLRVAFILAFVFCTLGACLLSDSVGPRGQAALGVVGFLSLAAVFSSHLGHVNWRLVATGLSIQFLLGAAILQSDAVREGFEAVGRGVGAFVKFANKGGEFVFGKLANFGDSGFIFAVQALPAVIFVSAVFTMLYHLRILQAVVWVFARAMILVLGKKAVSGAEALSATANVFLGQTEAPLIVKPYVNRMTSAELMTLMVGGMAHISGGMMVVYISMGADPVAILATSVMAAPASLYIAKLMLPEMAYPETRGTVKVSSEKQYANVVDAAAGGASDGMKLVINIVAMLIAFIAIAAMFNYLLAEMNPAWSLEAFFGKVFYPVSMMMGVSPEESSRVGELLGKKLVLNEFVAYKDLTDHYKPGMENGLSARSYALTTFALTGFANFSSIGIQLGGIGAMAPDKRKDLARLGMKALLGGFLATLINASIAGILR